MKPTKSLQLAAVLALASLICVSSATAQDGVQAVDAEEGVLGPASDPAPPRVTSQHLAVLSRRLADAEALEDIDNSIAEIRKVMQDLIEERKRWRDERERLANTLAAVEREIKDVNDDIDDIEDAIIASSIASAGVASPELIAIREGLIAKKNRLKAQRGELTRDFQAADQKIAQIDDLLKDAERRLAQKQAEKRALEEHIAEVSLTAPSEGARLLVDSSEELRISSDKPPEQIRIEVQKLVVSGGMRAGDPLRKSWETIYNRTLEWNDLGSAGPGVVSLAFKTGVKPQRRSIPIVGLEAFWLDRGEYRARVERLGETEHKGESAHNEAARNAANKNQKGGDGGGAPTSPSEGAREDDDPTRGDDPSYMPVPPATPQGTPHEWRRFSVVGKLDSEAFKKRAAGQADDPQIKYGSQQVKSGAVLRPTGAADEDEEDESDP